MSQKYNYMKQSKYHPTHAHTYNEKDVYDLPGTLAGRPFGFNFFMDDSTANDDAVDDEDDDADDVCTF